MLVERPSQGPARTISAGGADRIELNAVWLDLIDPTEEERVLASELTGLRVPSRTDLDEIESSSRLYREHDALYMSTPLTRRGEGRTAAFPIGFVVSERWVLTLRFTDYPSFDTYARTIENSVSVLGPHAVLTGLLESIVDRAADVLEYVAADLDKLSGRIFAGDGKRRERHQDQQLRGMLNGVGRTGDTVSMIGDSLLGLHRMTLFMGETFRDTVDQRLCARLETLERDIRSLTDFGTQVTNKVQFLLDATLGLISIEQNNGLRVITVASIIGVAPTLVASVYGMNFKNIPELNWAYGYYYALLLMAVTVVLPLLWFRRIGWI